MEQSNFYAMMSRMKYINRWGLMNNTKYENLSEHSLQVAMIAHCLVLIHNKKFGGNLNAERAGILAIFHDTTEIITGDMPTPIKYFNNTIKDAYKEIENAAADRLCSLLPEDFRKDMEEIIKQSGKDDLKLKRFVKAADRFSALIKCIEELRMGNEEFREAKNGMKNQFPI
jgi:Predicted hydrolases of HD superfamily